MDYKDALEAGSSAHGDNNRIVESDFEDDGTNWGSLAAKSSQSTSAGGKRKRNWASKGRYGSAAKRKKTGSPKKRKTVRKGAKKTPAKAKRTLGERNLVLIF